MSILWAMNLYKNVYISTVYRTFGILGFQSYRSDTKKGFKCRNKSYKINSIVSPNTL